MRSAFRTPRPQQRSNRSIPAASGPIQQVPLGDARFQALLAQANAFFDSAERDMEAEKAAVIAEIKGLMAKYQLTLGDIED